MLSNDKKVNNDDPVLKAINALNDAEMDLVSNLLTTNSRLWTGFKAVLGTTFFSLAVLGGSLYYMLPLKEKVPYLLVFDKATGRVDSLSILKPDELSGSEAVIKYFATQYVSAREGYNYNLLQNNYNTVMALSSTEEQGVYDSQFSKKDSIDKRYGNKLEIEISRIVVIPDMKNDKAIVRYVKTYKEPNKVPVEQYWTADISYFFSDPTKAESELYRSINPINFKVDQYRTSQEISR